jgi:hypothetical protein
VKYLSMNLEFGGKKDPTLGEEGNDGAHRRQELDMMMDPSTMDAYTRDWWVIERRRQARLVASVICGCTMGF